MDLENRVQSVVKVIDFKGDNPVFDPWGGEEVIPSRIFIL